MRPMPVRQNSPANGGVKLDSTGGRNRPTILDLLTNLYPEVLGRCIAHVNPLGQEKYKSSSPEH
jgi:hypothetical protein